MPETEEKARRRRQGYRAHPIGAFWWRPEEIDYLVDLTAVDCVRLQGSAERELRKTAERVHAKLKQVQRGRK